MLRRRAAVTVPRRVTNVSIRIDLLDAAREAGINLSACLERALSEDLAEIRRRQWLRDNRGAVEAYNENVEKHGTFAEGLRGF